VERPSDWALLLLFIMAPMAIVVSVGLLSRYELHIYPTKHESWWTRRRKKKEGEPDGKPS